MIGLSDDSVIMRSDETLRCSSFQTAMGDGCNVVDGKRQYAPPTEFDFICNVQTTTGDDLILVPEGDRFDEQLFLYVPTNQAAVPGLNDLVFRQDWYQVQACEDWESYLKIRMQRVDVGPDRAIGV